MNRELKLFALTALTALTMACGGEDPDMAKPALCNPACPTGQVCQAGVKGAPNFCAAAPGAATPTATPAAMTLPPAATPTPPPPPSTTPAPSSPSTGALSCSQIVDCINQCPTNDRACGSACLSRGTPSGQQTLRDFAGCLERTSCGARQSCDQDCATEIRACRADGQSSPAPSTPPSSPSAGGGAPSAGGMTLSCVEVLQCVANCDDDDACGTACVQRGTSTAQSRFLALVECINATGCATADACAAQCSMQFSDCRG